MIDLVERTHWFKSQILPHQAALRARLRKNPPSEIDLDDLVAEAMARAYAADDWNRISDGRPYLFRIARRMLVDAARREAIAGFDIAADLDHMLEGCTAGSMILARDELRQVQRAIETLPPQCRRVFVLCRVHERSIGEIAEEMELSVSTVEKHLAKALLLVSRAIADIEEGGLEHRRIKSGPVLREETAANLFVKLLDNPGAETRALLDGWCADDPRNAVAYARIEAAWERSAGLKRVVPNPEHEARPGRRNGECPGSDQ